MKVIILVSDIGPAAKSLHVYDETNPSSLEDKKLITPRVWNNEFGVVCCKL